MSDITINGNTGGVAPHVHSLSAAGQVSLHDKDNDAANSNYILIQSKEKPLNAVQKDKLSDKGVEIEEYVGKNTYLCSYKPTDLNPIRLETFISSAAVYSPDFVVEKDLKSSENSSEAVQVILHDDVEEKDLGKVADEISKAANIPVENVKLELGSGRMELSTELLGKVAFVDAVKYINRTPKPRLLNNEARKILLPDQLHNNSHYKGQGQIVCVADTGFDTGDMANCHEAFQARVKKLYPRGRPDRRGRPGKADDPDGHGTHVCGSVLGYGHSPNNGGDIEAPASKATLHMQSVFDKFHPTPGADPNDPMSLTAGLGGIGRYQDLFNEAYKDGARIHTNSWGSGPGKYADAGLEIDRYLWDHKEMVVLFAAGNEGTDAGVPDGKVDPGSIGCEASAKNCIAVGASENLRPDLLFGGGATLRYGSAWPGDFAKAPLRADKVANNPDGLAAFSSRGPTLEDEEWQRYKPDVVAPGTCILSTRSSHVIAGRYNEFWGIPNDSKWAYEGGTSMACPLVAGCCAVIRGCLVENGVHTPSAALIKALLVNGTVEMKGQYTSKEIGPPPDNNAGFGRVNLSNSLGSIVPESNEAGGYGDGPALDDRGTPPQPHTFKIPVPENGPTTLKITLVWTDPAGSKLQNDLDLIVTAPDGKTEMHGNVMNKTFTASPRNDSVEEPGAFDRQNNVEQIVWTGVQPGDYLVTVRVHRLAKRTTQPFAYAWRLY